MDDQSDTADAARPPVAVRTTALTLQVDNVIAEVVTAMREAGIRTLLLKDPRSPPGYAVTTLRTPTRTSICWWPRGPVGRPARPSGTRISPYRMFALLGRFRS